MVKIPRDRYFDLTLDECVEVLNALDELIVTDQTGIVKYISPDTIKTIERVFDQQQDYIYVNKHISDVNPSTLMPGFIKSDEEEKNIFHLANNLGTITRFKKIMEEGKLKLTLDYDLFRDEVELKKFLMELICFDNSDMLSLSDTMEELKYRMENPVKIRTSVNDIIGNSPQMEQLKKMIYSIAHSTVTVLICGETGTGKEMVARAIHATSPRASAPLIEINSAAIPENLFESEMFGYDDGAFTGAKKGGMLGKFELADKGTLFLDEIDQIPYHIQPKLLRALQEKSIDKLGGNSRDIDVRVIAATNKNLKQLVREGKFREDLYYRLNVIVLEIPPLREHKEDIPLLAAHFIKGYNNTFNKKIEGVSPEAMRRLYSYSWPGNIRELQNAIERAAVVTQSRLLQPEDFGGLAAEPSMGKKVREETAEIVPLEQVKCRAEKEAIARALKLAKNKTEAAEALGITRPALYYKMEKYGLK
ncbi:sigma 54-interacting transcriptional regulator [bacterium 210820-DFI.6.37]|nr:sigma 54-interacting transcriptional regulator [bacterium 210820-DFI.6.37]